MHPFRLAKLLAGVVLVAFATFAAQRVFAGSVEPSILESENGSLVSCNSEDVVVSAPADTAHEADLRVGALVDERRDA